MNGDDLGRLIYLGILLGVVAGFGLLRGGRVGPGLRSLGLWALIFLGVIAARGYWEESTAIPRQVAFSPAEAGGPARIEVPVAPDGHYYLTLELNDVPVRFTVDTGATDIVLSRRDAERIGIDPNRLAFLGSASTANGTVRTAPVRIERMALGGVVDRNVRASLTDGEMDGSLLGMSYLSRFDSLEIRGGRLILTRQAG